MELPRDDLLAGLRGMANALVLQTDLLGDIAIYQLGGSLTQTAYALLSDLMCGATAGSRLLKAGSLKAEGSAVAA